MIAIPGATVAQPPAAPAILQQFAGTWAIDTSQDEFGGRPVSRLIRDGVYRCGDCVTKVEVLTDGRFHAFAGGQDFDAVAVTVRGPREVEYRYRKAGRLAETHVERVSADGRELTYRVVNLTSATGKETVIEGRRARVGAAPAGAHAVSGDWRQLSGASESADALTLAIRVAGDTATIVQPTGRQVTARIGGPPAALVGDQAGRTMRIAFVPPRTLATTTMIAGKDVQTATITLNDDTRRLTFDARDLTLGQTVRFVARRQ